MKEKFIEYYMQVAELISTLSTAEKLKVGCVIVKDDRILSQGYNGTPSGWDNTCEDKVWDGSDYVLQTKPEVMHAERNALDKLAKSSGGGDGSSLFVTHAPCLECAKSIYATGIKRVFYRNQYRTLDGVNFLDKCGIGVNRVI